MSSRLDDEWVSVDLLDEAPAEPSRPARRLPARGLAVVAAVVVSLLAALVVWPEPSASPEADDQTVPAELAAPDDPRLLGWPGRGPWAGDEAFLDQAAAVWRASAADAESGPGEDVHALWAGPVGEVDIALLQSVGLDGRARVAQVSESRIPGSASPGSLILTAAEVIEGDPPFITLAYAGGLGLDGVLQEPGSSLVQVLPAPDLLAEGVQLQRREQARFETVGVGPDSLTYPWVHTPLLAPGGPLLASVRTQGAFPGLERLASIGPDRLLPTPAPVQLVPSAWGRLRKDLPQDYLDAELALASLGRSSGRASVLGMTPLAEGHASLVEVRPAGVGDPVVMTVGSTNTSRTSRVVSQPRAATPPEEVALGAARSPAGDLLVVAAAPPDAALLLVFADGQVVARGGRTTAAWLPRGRDVGEVAVQAYRDDQRWVGRTSLDVSDL